MRRLLGVLLLAGSAVTASAPAFGFASASVTVNGTTHTLSQTGFLFTQIGGSAVNLAPGQSADFNFSYSISVQDSGLPAGFDPAGTGCTALFPTTCGPAYTGFEYAKAYVIVLAQDPRIVHNPSVVEDGLRGTATLATHGDSFAEALTDSGVLQGHIQVLDVSGANTFINAYPSFIALWVLANPVPEPAVAMQMVAGLALLGAALARRRRISREP